MHDPSIEDLLAAARADFASRLPARAAEVQALVADGAWDEARRAVHKLRGSAATYGFAGLGAAVAALEDLLLAAAATVGIPRPVDARIAEKVREVRAEADRAGQEQA